MTNIDEVIYLVLDEALKDTTLSPCQRRRSNEEDQRFISYCSQLYSFLKEYRAGDGKSFTIDELIETTRGWTAAYLQYFWLLENNKKAKQIYMSKSNFALFLNHLVRDTYGLNRPNANDGFVLRTSTPTDPPKLNIFAMIKELVNGYRTKRWIGSKSKNKRPPILLSQNAKSVTLSTIGVEPIQADLLSYVNPQFWDNIYHDIDTCRFNGDAHFSAAFLDSLDPYIHYLCINIERLNHATALLPNPLAIIIIHESTDPIDEYYLVVEGVFGNFLRETKEAVNQTNLIFTYIYKTLIELAYTGNAGLFFNHGFNTKHPSQGAIEWVNFMSLMSKKPPVYTCIDEQTRRYRYNLEKEGSELRGYKPQDELLFFEFSKIKSEECDSRFGPNRYVNTYFNYNRMLSGTTHSSVNLAWGPPTGKVFGKRLTIDEVRREYSRMTCISDELLAIIESPMRFFKGERGLTT